MYYINTDEFLIVETIIKEKLCTSKSLHDLCKKYNISKQKEEELEKIFVASNNSHKWVRSLEY